MPCVELSYFQPMGRCLFSTGERIQRRINHVNNYKLHVIYQYVFPRLLGFSDKMLFYHLLAWYASVKCFSIDQIFLHYHPQALTLMETSEQT